MPMKKNSFWGGELTRFCLVSTVLLFPASLGRTPLLGIFKPFLEKQLTLTAAQLGMVYTLGTLLASFAVGFIGEQLCLKFSTTKLIALTYGLFALVPLGLACICSLKPGKNVSSLFALLLLFTGLRFCSQGMLPLVLRNLTGIFCKKQVRSWVASLHTTFLTLAVGLLTWGLVRVGEFITWNWIWLFQSLVLGIMSLIGIKFLPNLPLQFSSKKSAFSWGSLGQKSLLFFLCVFLLGLHSFQATAVAFHLSSFVSEKAFSLKKAFSLFLPISILGIFLNPFCAWFANRCSLRTLMVFLFLSMWGVAWALANLNALSGSLFFVFCSALGWSLNHILCYLISPALLEFSNIPLGNTIIIGTSTFLSALGPLCLGVLARLSNDSYVRANDLLVLLGFFVIFSLFLLKNKVHVSN